MWRNILSMAIDGWPVARQVGLVSDNEDVRPFGGGDVVGGTLREIIVFVRRWNVS